MNIRLYLIPLLLIACQAFGDAAPAPDGRDFDLQGFIDGQIAAGKQEIIVPPGRYRVTPRRTVHLQFKDLHDIRIIADGVEMICTETTQAISFEHCRNVVFKGLTVDYDPLPFTEGRIVALAPDKSWIEFELIPGYPEDQVGDRIEIFNPASGELRRRDAGWEPGCEKIGPRRYRVVKAGRKYNPAEDLEQAGDILVIDNVHAPGGSSGHAMVCADCKDMVIEYVSLYASNCFGFLELNCDNTKYLHCHIDRRSPADDPVKRGFPRMRSLDADAYHSIGAVKGPSLIGCSARFQADDCVNIHGTYYMTAGCDGTALRVLSDRSLNIAPGDPVEFLPYSGTRPPNGKALDIAPDAPLTEQEKGFIMKQRLDARIKAGLLSENARAFRITLDRAASLPMGSLVCSGSRVGNGFLVKDCIFGYNRSRGILIKASNGEVSGNRISHAWMASVLVAPEYWWLEAASSSNLVIKDNIIDGCLGTGIDVQADGGDGKPLAAGAHSNIAISGNKISGSPWPDISAASTVGLTITGNDLPAAAEEKLPLLARKWTWNSGTPSPIVTINCATTEIENNQ